MFFRRHVALVEVVQKYWHATHISLFLLNHDPLQISYAHQKTDEQNALGAHAVTLVKSCSADIETRNNKLGGRSLVAIQRKEKHPSILALLKFPHTRNSFPSQASRIHTVTTIA